MKKLYTIFIITLVLCLLIAGCAGSLGNIQAADPMERGLSYIACAIVTHGVLGLFRS